MQQSTIEIRRPDAHNLFGDPYWVWPNTRAGAQVLVADNGRVYVTGNETSISADEALELATALASAHAWVANQQ